MAQDIKKVQGIGGLKEATGGARRTDRNSEIKYKFEPISIDAENALTVLYMLSSPEGDVVLRAISALERFGRRALENLQLLTTLGIFDYVIPLIRHEDYLVKRFAQKLIASLSALEEFRQLILADDLIVLAFVTILENEEDVVMQEFSSLTLYHLSSDYAAAGRILQMDGCVDALLVRLESMDPDVQKNCLDTIANLLNEIDGVQYFVFSPLFSMKPFVELTFSSYPAIQVATLEVIDKFLSWSMNNRILFAFRDAMGIETTIAIVENDSWEDLHILSLNIILKVTDNPAICDYLRMTGCVERLVHLLGRRDGKEYLAKLLGAMARLSQTEQGRKALHSHNMGQIFAEYLQQNCEEVQEPACLGVANMCQFIPAVDSILSTNPAPYLIDLVTDSTKNWNLRGTAALALSALAQKNQKISGDLIEESKFERLLPLLNEKVPVEMVLNILKIFTAISSYEIIRPIFTTESVIQSIINLIQDPDENYLKPAAIQVAALECLSILNVDDAGRVIFENVNGVQKLIGCLNSRYASIRQWAALLTIQLSQNINFVKSFIRRGGLKRLIDAREMRYSAPSWESAIEAIFSSYLPAKFAYTGRLEFHDLTQEGFFILRTQSRLFFVLDELLEVRASPAYPIYVANFWSGSPYPSKESVPVMTTSGKSFTGATDLENFAFCPKDPYLGEYLNHLRAKLAKEVICTSCRDPQWLAIHPRLIRQRAQVLARFVADEMCGPYPDPACKNHSLEMHLNDIRYELETNTIPLGYIRIGSYLERALLFKVLADKIGLPCALVRGSYGRSWVEIAIPVLNIDEPLESKETQTSFPETPTSYDNSDSSSEGVYRMATDRSLYAFPPSSCAMGSYPSCLLKPNAIVDLIHEPGRILQIGSYEADEYRGCFLCMNKF